MSFLPKIRDGLTSAHQGVSKYIVAANINRVIQDVRGSFGNTAPQISYQAHLDEGTQGQAEAATNVYPHVEIAMTKNENASKQEENYAGSASEASETAKESLTTIIPSPEDAEGPGRPGADPWNNPWLIGAAAVTGTGLLVVAAPALVTAPMMAAAGAAGFTPAGIAASSVASAVHAGIGNVAAGSLFATMQSASMGGYGVAVLTGAAQTAGGTVAGAGVVGGAAAWLKGKPKE